MPKPPPLTEQQRTRLRRLEPQLRAAASRGDFEQAKRISVDLQQLLRPTGHHTRLMQQKNWVYEAAMEAGQLDTAVRGFRGVRKIVAHRTRVYLEATALLAICYLRRQEIAEAEPLMSEVLQNDDVIRSERRRYQFRRRLIQRFEEETVLAALQGKDTVEFDAQAVQNDAVEVVRTKTEDQILADIGTAVPKEVIAALLRVHDFATKQLPPSERLLLPPPAKVTAKTELGRTVLAAAKRVVWRSLCDPDDEVYKAWCEQGLMGLLDRKVLTPAVILALSGVKVGVYALAVSITALIIKMGLNVVCEVWKPDGVMIHVSER